MISKPQLILIHTAKRQIEKINPDFDDAQYRTVLRSIAHVESSKDLDNKSFEQVMAWFESVGFRQTTPAQNTTHGQQSAGYWETKAARHATWVSERELSMIDSLAKDCPYPLGSLVWRLSNHRTDKVAELTRQQGYALIEALKKIVAREAAKALKPVGRPPTVGSLSPAELQQIEQDVLP